MTDYPKDHLTGGVLNPHSTPDRPRGRITSFVDQPPAEPPRSPSTIDLMLEGVNSIQGIADAQLQRLNQMHQRAFGMPLSCMSKPTAAPSHNAASVKAGRMGDLNIALKQLEATLGVVSEAILEIEGIV